MSEAATYSMLSKLKTINFSKIIFWVYIFFIIGFAVYARTNVLSWALPFFDDEADLMLNISTKNCLSLCLPLDEGKIGPPVFLILGRLIYLKYGLNELMLRVVPYIGSVLSVLCFFWLSLIVLKKKTSILFVNFIFAINEHLLVFTHTFKQYSFDTLTSLIILIAFIKLKDAKLTNLQLFLLSIFATLLILCSYTAIFVMVTSFFTLCLYKYQNKNILYQKENNTKEFYKPTKEDIKKFFPFIIPFVMFMTVYFFVTCLPSQSDYLHMAWKRVYDSNEYFFPNSLQDTENFFRYLFGYRNFYTPAVIVWFVLSLYVLFKKEKVKFVFFFLPFMMGAILGFMELYPFASERVSLYLVPMFFMILGYGLDEYCEKNKEEFIVFIFLNILIIINDYKMAFEPLEHVMYSDRLHKYFVNSLYQSDLTNDDYIYTKGTNLKVLQLYDYKKSLDKTKMIVPVFDEGLYFNTKSTLDNIPKGANIFFNTGSKVDTSDMCIDEEEWIKDNCEIIYSADAYYGNFIKCKKIK